MRRLRALGLYMLGLAIGVALALPAGGFTGHLPWTH